MMSIPNVGFNIDELSLLITKEELKSFSRPLKRLYDVLSKGSKTPIDQATKHWNLVECQSPVKFNGDHDNNLQSITLETNRLDTTEQDVTKQKPIGTGAFSEIESTLCFKSIGYKSIPLDGFDSVGLPFDTRQGIIPNITGRIAANGKVLPGWYVSGWVKRGPTGVIASTMYDAFETGDALADDWESETTSFLTEGNVHGWDGVKSETQFSNQIVSWHDWERINEYELEKGKERGKERYKITSVKEMLAVASSSSHR